MACTSCGTDGDKSKGCRSNGGCDSGGCNKLNTYDWLSTMELEDPSEVNLVEVSFRNGAHKAFFKLQNMLQAETGDTVVVEADGGYDVGEISLKGALVPLQMKKKSVDINTAVRSVMRVASQQDVDKLVQARSNDRDTMVRARAISAMLGIDMKIGDVEFRADMKKATFFYTADGRVDFRELIRHFAKEFRVKIEMRQIGSRQESSRIGGLGSCGRELCCSTWLTDYKSVTTNAARYQNLSINQAKLSGQCGRLKCCLNYELDVYMEALEDFPTNADNLQYVGGYAKLIKTDIFKKLMFYIKKDKKGREAFITMTVDEVVAMQKDISRGKIPEDIVSTRVEYLEDIDHMKSEDLTGHIELPEERRKAKKKNKGRGEGSGRTEGQPRPDRQARPEGNTRNQRDGERKENGPRKDENKRPQNQQRSNQNRPERRPDGPRPERGPDDKRPDARPSGPRPDRSPKENGPDKWPEGKRPERGPNDNRPERKPEGPRPENRSENKPDANKNVIFPLSGGQTPPVNESNGGIENASQGPRPENPNKKRNNNRRNNRPNRPAKPGGGENDPTTPKD